MRKTQSDPRKLVDRLEKKYQKKVRFEKYKSFARNFRQNASRVQGVPVAALDDESLDMFNIRGYEYIS